LLVDFQAEVEQLLAGVGVDNAVVDDSNLTERTAR